MLSVVIDGAQGSLSDAVNLSKIRLPFPSWRGQGWKDGNTDIRAFKSQLFEGKVHAPKSLAMRSAFAEARTLMDPAGNQKLAVKSEAGRRSNARDDLTAAVILADCGRFPALTVSAALESVTEGRSKWEKSISSQISAVDGGV